MEWMYSETRQYSRHQVVGSSYIFASTALQQDYIEEDPVI